MVFVCNQDKGVVVLYGRLWWQTGGMQEKALGNRRSTQRLRQLPTGGINNLH